MSIKNLTYCLVCAVVLFIFNPKEARGADRPIVSESANLKAPKAYQSVNPYKLITLKEFLIQYNSPMHEYSYEFIHNAQENDMDWRLLPSIAGVESTFGKNIPKGSYNAYGWNNGNYYFESWEGSIEHVTSVLKNKYIDRGYKSISEIAPIYAPPSNSWGWKVKFFSDKIDPYPLEYTI